MNTLTISTILLVLAIALFNYSAVVKDEFHLTPDGRLIKLKEISAVVPRGDGNYLVRAGEDLIIISEEARIGLVKELLGEE